MGRTVIVIVALAGVGLVGLLSYGPYVGGPNTTPDEARRITIVLALLALIAIGGAVAAALGYRRLKREQAEERRGIDRSHHR